MTFIFYVVIISNSIHRPLASHSSTKPILLSRTRNVQECPLLRSG